jgi:hypothetical protein
VLLPEPVVLVLSLLEVPVDEPEVLVDEVDVLEVLVEELDVLVEELEVLVEPLEEAEALLEPLEPAELPEVLVPSVVPLHAASPAAIANISAALRMNSPR